MVFSYFHKHFQLTRAGLEVFLNVDHPHLPVRVHWVPLKVLEQKSKDWEGLGEHLVLLGGQSGQEVVLYNKFGEKTPHLVSR